MFKKILLASCLMVFTQNLLALTPQYMLGVVEEKAGTLSFYDANGENLGKIKVGYLPHEITISKDQTTAYVTNFGIKDYDENIGTPGASISVIDIPSRAEKYRLFTFTHTSQHDLAQINKAPHGIKLRPPLEHELYVNVEQGGKMLVFDLANKKIKRTFAINKNTHNFVFSPNGKIIWLMAGRDGVIRIDAETGAPLGNLKFDSAIRGLKYTPDNRYIMASAGNEIILINPVNLQIEKRFNNLGVTQFLYSDMSPDLKYIVAPAVWDNQVIIIEVKTGKVVKRIVTGIDTVTVAISPDSHFAYVTNANDNHVTRIDLTTFATQKIYTQPGPNSIAFIEPATIKQHKILNVGVALPLSGKDAAAGRDMMRGYELWRARIMQAGGLWVGNEAYDVNAIYLDTQSNPTNVTRLTEQLIKHYHVDILLTNNNVTDYNLEKALAFANHIPILATPNFKLWEPDSLVNGKDYFITTARFAQDFYNEYSFKATHYSAMAVARGVALQQALLLTNSLEYSTLSRALEENKFAVFYPG